MGEEGEVLFKAGSRRGAYLIREFVSCVSIIL